MRESTSSWGLWVVLTVFSMVTLIVADYLGFITK